jgi:MYXO-CTERM domain-containing protein
MRRLRAALATAVFSVLAGASPARGQADLELVEVRVDPPTLHTIGVQVLIQGDDDRDAGISVRVRRAGDEEWRAGPPLFRVRPETVSEPVPGQFAGSLFDLSPGTSYQIELHAVDPDGLDETRTVEATTRPVPAAEPAHPRAVAVGDADELRDALAAAQPGDVITLADGTYAGSFAIEASGSAEDPIVLRGSPTAVLDGGGCDGCNVLEVYGSYVHVEAIALEHATRALRFLGAGATGNVARRLRIRDVVHGIGSSTDQTGFTICDNHIEGRLVWPWTFAEDATSHWDDRGVDMNGTGHVVCHNLIRGFGDPVVNKHRLVRAWDVYGNDIYDAFDGTELDEGEGNVRLFGNRYTNVMAPISIQPVFGGPAYVLRNVLFNVPDEQIKLKSLGGTEEPSGALIYHNTFVSPELALNLQTPISQHNFVVANNLFIGPEQLAGARTVDWTAAIDGGRFDHNGYFPDGGFWFGVVDDQNRIYDSFAAVLAAGEVEQGGVLLGRPIFADDVVGPDGDGSQAREPPDLALADGSGAIDRGEVIPGLNDGFVGDGPDLGARETGCPEPVYGPRPAGMEAVTNAVNCSADDDGIDPGSDAGPDDGDGQAGDGGCGCRAARERSSSGALVFLIMMAVAISTRRR